MKKESVFYVDKKIKNIQEKQLADLFFKIIDLTCDETA